MSRRGLPGLLRVRQGLTPLAAAGLAVIMAGATATTLAIAGGASAAMPLVLGLLAAFVVYGRTRGPRRPAGGPPQGPVLRPAS